ncbi:MAG: hypothetical protein ACYCVZ_13420, partial [Streptosporangiaceae bacterium]
MRRVLAVIAVLLAMVVGVITVTLGSFNGTLASLTAATTAERVVARAVTLRVVFDAEQLATYRYLTTDAPAALAAARARHAEFAARAVRVGPSGEGAAALAR